VVGTTEEVDWEAAVVWVAAVVEGTVMAVAAAVGMGVH
jgi:hypothetical protein